MMNYPTNKNIQVIKERSHAKASERYVDVVFEYPDEHDSSWDGSVPVEYRRTGVRAETPEEIDELLDEAYDAMRPSRAAEWNHEQDEFWAGKRAEVTKSFFDALLDAQWKCQGCDLPQNPNWARRVQDLKESGFTLATDFQYCPNCTKKTTHLIMLKIKRGGTHGYETISSELRKRIMSVLENLDVYENSGVNRHLLPDHKFPEVRWDESTREENSDTMSDEEIMAKFQLLNNQRNQQKREVCRSCFQTRQRGTPFGIAYFYEGESAWPEGVLETGRAAEHGCIGCGWYDMKVWRERLNELLTD